MTDHVDAHGGRTHLVRPGTVTRPSGPGDWSRVVFCSCGWRTTVRARSEEGLERASDQAADSHRRHPVSRVASAGRGRAAGPTPAGASGAPWLAVAVVLLCLLGVVTVLATRGGDDEVLTSGAGVDPTPTPTAEATEVPSPTPTPGRRTRRAAPPGPEPSPEPSSIGTRQLEDQSFLAYLSLDESLAPFTRYEDEANLRLGRALCTDLSRGQDEYALAFQVAEGLGVEPEAAAAFIGAAAGTLCEEHMDVFR